MQIEENILHSLVQKYDQVVFAQDKKKSFGAYGHDIWNLKINFGKTEHLVVGGNATELNTKETKVEACNNFTYLGSIINAKGK